MLFVVVFYYWLLVAGSKGSPKTNTNAAFKWRQVKINPNWNLPRIYFCYRCRKSKTTTEMSLSLILLFIVAVFLCCNFPRLVLNMAEFVNLDTARDRWHYCSSVLRLTSLFYSCHNVENHPWFLCLTGWVGTFVRN